MTRLEAWSESPEGSIGRVTADLFLQYVELGIWTREQAERVAEEFADHLLSPVNAVVQEILEDTGP